MSPFSYRADPAVPAFDDSRPLFVFDGTCVLCSGGAAFLMRRRRGQAVRFAPAQSPLGRALYAHYGLPLDDSYLLLDQGKLYTKTDGYLHLARVLGGAWRLAAVTRLIPRRLRDAGYDLVARNRYGWFGTADQCALLTPAQRARLVDAAA